MEGPSLVIASEELTRFNMRRPLSIEAVSKSLKMRLQGHIFLSPDSWGKHLLLRFDGVIFRIHFLMFGSYRIDHPRENRVPKLKLTFENGTVYFYSCAIKEISVNDYQNYDWELDLISPEWNEKRALASLLKKPQQMLCDVLMDQTIFSGLGNIMKNEILFWQKLHPETPVENLSSPQLMELIRASQAYAWQFYEWKKIGEFKRNWQIMRKKKCPVCSRSVIKKPTGKGGRLSHFCSYCQKKSKL